MKLSNAKSYFGKIEVSEDDMVIRLSKWNLDAGKWAEQEDIDEIIDTICHEFAHIYCWEHDAAHKAMTNAFVDIVNYGLIKMRKRYIT